MKRAMTIRVLSAVLALAAFAMTSPSVAKPRPAWVGWALGYPVMAAGMCIYCVPEDFARTKQLP